MLSGPQQEHFARHLLLDGFGGDGQEKLLLLSVEVRGSGVAARWAARYLASSGVGHLAIDPAFEAECSALAPWTSFGRGAPTDLTIEPVEAETPAESAMRGAQVALDVLRSLA